VVKPEKAWVSAPAPEVGQLSINRSTKVKGADTAAGNVTPKAKVVEKD
jgi:hypothetical protein